MRAARIYSGPADRSTPCDECGGPTYTFDAGDIWCPAEDPHPGGHFVKRVTERVAQVVTRKVARASAPATVPATVPPTNPEPAFDTGYDDFVSSE